MRLRLLLLLGVLLTLLAAPGALAGNATLGIPSALPEPAEDASIDDWRAWCRFEAERRRGKVESLFGEVSASLSLSAAHRSGLDAMLTSTRDGIEAIDASLAAESDLAALKQTCVRIETEHLVFSLRTPQVQNVIGADAVVTRSRQVESESTTLAPQIDAAELIGNPYVARMRELNAEVTALALGARGTVAGVANALLALTPPDWLAQRDVLVPYQERNRSARTDLEKAKADIEEIKRLLQWRPPDATPPVIVPAVSGPLGLDGWHTGDATVGWTVSDDGSAVTATSGCDPATVTADTPAQSFTCSATSEGGTQSVTVTVKRDGTAPTVSFATHPVSYTVDQTVSISCTGADATAGLGAPCKGVNSPAYELAIGENTVSATVTDRAGNSATSTTSFAVTVTPTSLCNLTKQFVEGTDRYRALSKSARKAVDKLAATACKHADGCSAKLSAGQKRKLVSAYKVAVAALRSPGWLNQIQADLLVRLADKL
ncbi:MAG: hypothetical protein U0R50_05080 [Gaiellales bacterium]